MRKRLITVTAILLFLMVSVIKNSTQAGPVFINGSFEDYTGDITSPYTDLYDNVMLDGWTTNNGLSRLDVFSAPGYNASDGNTALWIHPTIDQAIQVVTGFIIDEQYILSFDLAPTAVWHDTQNPFWGDGSSSTQGVQVYANGVRIGTITLGRDFDTNAVFGDNPFTYRSCSIPFIADASDIEFRFDILNSNEQGVALDKIKVSARADYEIVIEDFEGYTIGEPIVGQGNWSSGSDCGPIVAIGELPEPSGILRSSSCYYGQSAYRMYPFQFNTNMNHSYLQFTGRITSGYGANCCSLFHITGSLAGGSFGFGMKHNTGQGVNYQTALRLYPSGDFIYGDSLIPGVWYDFRLEIDWTYTSTIGKGLACLKYKPMSESQWVSDSNISNIELTVEDPTKFDGLMARMDGYNSRLGEMDNLLVSYGGFNDVISPLTILEPDGIDDTIHDPANPLYVIRWNWDEIGSGYDPIVSLYYDTDRSMANGSTLIAENIQANVTHEFTWDTSTLPIGAYYVYARVNSVNGLVMNYSKGQVIIPPSVPVISGPTEVDMDKYYGFQFISDHHRGDVAPVTYEIKWEGEDSSSEFKGPCPLGDEETVSHRWLSGGNYCVKARAHSHKGVSRWSECHYITSAYSLKEYKKNSKDEGLFWYRQPNGNLFDLNKPTVIYIHGWADGRDPTICDFAYPHVKGLLEKNYNVGFLRWEDYTLDFGRFSAGSNCDLVSGALSRVWGNLEKKIPGAGYLFEKELYNNFFQGRNGDTIITPETYKERIILLAHSFGAQAITLAFKDKEAEWEYDYGEQLYNSSLNFQIVYLDPYVPSNWWGSPGYDVAKLAYIMKKLSEKYRVEFILSSFIGRDWAYPNLNGYVNMADISDWTAYLYIFPFDIFALKPMSGDARYYFHEHFSWWDYSSGHRDSSPDWWENPGCFYRTKREFEDYVASQYTFSTSYQPFLKDRPHAYSIDWYFTYLITGNSDFLIVPDWIPCVDGHVDYPVLWWYNRSLCFSPPPPPCPTLYILNEDGSKTYQNTLIKSQILPSLEKTSLGRIRDSLAANQKLIIEEPAPDIDYINRISLLGLKSSKDNIYLDQSQIPVAFNDEDIEYKPFAQSQDDYYEYKEIDLDTDKSYYFYITASLEEESVAAVRQNLYPHIAYQNFYEIAGGLLSGTGQGLYLFADFDIETKSESGTWKRLELPEPLLLERNEARLISLPDGIIGVRAKYLKESYDINTLAVIEKGIASLAGIEQKEFVLDSSSVPASLLAIDGYYREIYTEHPLGVPLSSFIDSSEIADYDTFYIKTHGYYLLFANALKDLPPATEADIPRISGFLYKVKTWAGDPDSHIEEMANFFRSSVTLTEPDGNNDIADTSYTIQWTDNAPNSRDTISLYYYTELSGENGPFTLIVDNIRKDGTISEYIWDTSLLAEGDYYIYAAVEDGLNDPSVSYGSGKVTINHTPQPLRADWHFVSPTPQSNSLKAVWTASYNNAFAVGDKGTIIYYNGSEWTEMESGTDNNLNHLWGISANDLFAVGENGTILHYDGNSWAKMELEGNPENDPYGIVNDLYCIWGSSSNNIFAVGDSGMIIHYDGSAWSEMTSNTGEWLYSIWGDAGNNIFAVGSSGIILHYDGADWTQMTSNTNNWLFGIWGSSGTNVFAVGWYGAILHYDGNSWAEIESSTENHLYSIWGCSDGDVYTAGGRGMILHNDGTDWAEIESNTNCDFHSIGGSNSDNVYAVGDRGMIFRFADLPPSISIIKPDWTNDTDNGASYTIKWKDYDPGNNAAISLYYDTDNSGKDGVLIANNISEDDDADKYVWDTSQIPVGDYYVYAAIDDGVNNPVVDYSTGIVTIKHNHIPRITSEAISQTSEDEPYEYDVEAVDEDQDTITYILQQSPREMTINSQTGLIAWTPLQADVGDHAVVIIVTDGNLNSASVQSFMLTVNNGNDTPVVTQIIPQTQTIDEDTTFETFDLDDFASDEDGDALTWTFTGNENLQVDIDTENRATITTPEDWYGEENITFTASDPENASASSTVLFIVNPVNDTPVAADQNIPTDEDTIKEITLIASDVDGDELSYTIVSPPEHGTLSGTAPSLTYTPNENYNGPDSFTFKANDIELESNTATVSITINPVNDAPVIKAGIYQTVKEGMIASLDLATFTDADYADIHTAMINWGDGTDVVSGIIDQIADTVSGNHAYMNNGIYMVTITVIDNEGGVGIDTLNIVVDNVAPTVNVIRASSDPVKVNTKISASAGFTDPGCEDIHFGIWDWGDDTISNGGVIEIEGYGVVSGTHIYQIPGVYTIKLTVRDDEDDEGVSPEFNYLVVYDPDAGFVTGGGWIESPPEAYSPDPWLTGKANFSLVSKYKKGATIPTGETEFNFKIGDFNFHSTSYEWLVVAGEKAQCKGAGTVNGDGEYKFMLIALDADINGNDNFDVDRFRIRIWEEDIDNNKYVIYDSGLDKDDSDKNALTEIGGGSIKIHSSGLK